MTATALQDGSSPLPVFRAAQDSAIDARGLHPVAAEADAWTARLDTEVPATRYSRSLGWRGYTSVNFSVFL